MNLSSLWLLICYVNPRLIFHSPASFLLIKRYSNVFQSKYNTALPLPLLGGILKNAFGLGQSFLILTAYFPNIILKLQF